jgi:hypothetical protein
MTKTANGGDLIAEWLAFRESGSKHLDHCDQRISNFGTTFTRSTQVEL